MSIKEVYDHNFQEEVLESKIPVLVEFSAPWCGPCRALYPILQELATEHKDIKFLRLDVDDNPNIADIYAINSLPTLILFHGQEIKSKKLGLQSKDILKQILSLKNKEEDKCSCEIV